MRGLRRHTLFYKIDCVQINLPSKEMYFTSLTAVKTTKEQGVWRQIPGGEAVVCLINATAKVGSQELA